MDEKLETFAAECHRILEADPGPSGIEAVREQLEPLLVDAEFVATYLGPDNDTARKILYQDSELDFCILAHVYKGSNEAPPHDHGPSWAIYGQATGKTEMTEYDKVGDPSADEPGKAAPRETYVLEPGMAVAYKVGQLHSPKRDGETRLIRMEGQNLEGVKRDKYQRA
ncbi:MAG: hypothetical protein GKS02_04550 [Alphaproteobacteria bacterium]|nr:hypothetical protein [Alphaproteobacteria bacterium]